MTEPNDKLLDEYLRGESPVSQRYRELEAHDVPPQLDATVLAQARAAVADRGKRKPTWMRWGAPLALAASAVMAVAIVLEIGVQDEVRVAAPRVEQVTSAERAQDLRAVEEATMPEVSNELPAPAPAEAPQVERASERKVAPEANVATTAAREGFTQDTPVESQAASADESLDRVVARRRDASESPAVQAMRAPQAPPAVQAAPAPQPPPTVSEREMSAITVQSAQEAPRLSAEEWLERIRTLRREGKVLEADEQWREFRKTYPDFVVGETDAARPKPSP